MSEVKPEAIAIVDCSHCVDVCGWSDTLARKIADPHLDCLDRHKNKPRAV
jgi:hypothetical protein